MFSLGIFNRKNSTRVQSVTHAEAPPEAQLDEAARAKAARREADAKIIDAIIEKHNFPFGTRYRENSNRNLPSVGSIDAARAQFIGKNVDDVVEHYNIREVIRDGRRFFVEQDRRPTRCNVEVKKNIIVDICNFG
jgi:hypothetical protein